MSCSHCWMYDPPSTKALSGGTNMQQGSTERHQLWHFQPQIACQQAIAESCTQYNQLSYADADRLILGTHRRMCSWIVKGTSR